MTRKPSPPMSKVAAVLREGGPRGDLGRWLQANHDEFAALISAYGANWKRLAEMFKAEGLMGPKAKPETAKRTWQRVRIRVGKGRGNAPASGSQPVQVVQPAVPAVPATSAADTPQTHRPRLSEAEIDEAFRAALRQPDPRDYEKMPRKIDQGDNT